MTDVIPISTGMKVRQEDAAPGLVMHEDGSLWLIGPDGSETAVGGGGAPPTASVTATMDEIRDSLTTPILIAEPPAGYVIVDAVVLFTFNSDFAPFDAGDWGARCVITNDPTLAQIIQVFPMNELVPALAGGIPGEVIVEGLLASLVADSGAGGYWSGPTSLYPGGGLYFAKTSPGNPMVGGDGSITIATAMTLAPEPPE